MREIFLCSPDAVGVWSRVMDCTDATERRPISTPKFSTIGSPPMGYTYPMTNNKPVREVPESCKKLRELARRYRDPSCTPSTDPDRIAEILEKLADEIDKEVFDLYLESATRSKDHRFGPG